MFPQNLHQYNEFISGSVGKKQNVMSGEGPLWYHCSGWNFGDDLILAFSAAIVGLPGSSQIYPPVLLKKDIYTNHWGLE